MKFMRFAFVVAAAALASQAPAQVAVPQFQVDASWPKPLPNRWILGRQGNLYTSEVNTGQWIQKFRRVDRQE